MDNRDIDIVAILERVRTLGPERKQELGEKFIRGALTDAEKDELSQAILIAMGDVEMDMAVQRGLISVMGHSS